MPVRGRQRGSAVFARGEGVEGDFGFRNVGVIEGNAGFHDLVHYELEIEGWFFGGEACGAEVAVIAEVIAEHGGGLHALPEQGVGAHGNADVGGAGGEGFRAAMAQVMPVPTTLELPPGPMTMASLRPSDWYL